VNRQIRVLGVVLILAFAVLFLQLNNLQVLQASKLANATGNFRKYLQRFNDPRGVIQTADGVVVAKSTPTTGTYKYQRQYPQGPLFAQITGYVSYVYGSDGVESSYNSDLTGHNLPIRYLGDLLTSRTVTEDLTLTLTQRLQQVAATALGSKVGAVVALDPSNGAVLAMYSNPSYDPNPLASHSGTAERAAWTANQASPARPMLARAYRERYAPGSTFKVITAAAVLDHDPVLATRAYPNVTQIPLPNTTHTLSNFAHETCGGMLPDLFRVSCDTGFGQIGLDMGAQSLAAEAQSFGFNQVPPLDLPSPVAVSTFPPPASFAQNQPGLAFSAIGQENVSASALQMALVASGVANRGVIMTPHVMAQIRDNQGRLVRAYKPQVWLTATSPQTAASVTTYMVSVVNAGTAQGVMNLPNVQVAAKTGTAQTNATAGSNNWMIAFAPAQAPKVAVAVVVPAQPGLPVDAQGATVAGPIAKTVLAAALGLPGS
jgi:peptidoglycan glycosyltransferase